MRVQLGQRGSQGAPGVVGKLFFSVFFGIFAVVGTSLFVFLGGMAWRTVATYAWEETPCTIAASTMNTGDEVESAPGWQVRYHYTVAGQEYESTQLSRGGFARDFSTDLRLSQRYVPGQVVTCYVNPDTPGEAVLLRTGLATALWGLFPLPFMAVGWGGLIFTWSRRSAAPGMGAASAVTARARRSSGVAGTAFAVLFFGAFFAIGTTLTWMIGVKPVLRVLAANDWAEVPCTIVSSSVEEHDSDDGTTYSVRMLYRYEFEGRTYTADRYKFMGSSSSGRAGKHAVVQRHPAGSAAVCFVNPADPTEAVIERSFTGDMAFGFIPLVFAVVGAGGLIGFTVRRARGSGARSFPRAGTSLRPDPTAAPLAGGAMVLEARGSRMGKFIGLTVFALFWNGIVSVFIVTLVQDWSRGGPDWFLLLFLIPFVGVGLVIVGMAIHAGLGMFNPRPRLRVSPAAVPPGGRVELTWEMTGNPRRLQRFHIFLEGREEATYRRGTDTRTDKAVFATLDVADVRDAAIIATGRASLGIPRGVMHSWAAKNNKIVWTLRVRGEIPRWPDIDDEFEFTVLPVAPPTVGTP